MLVVLAGNAYFAAPLQRMGCEVIHIPHAPVVTWAEVLARAGRPPDLFVYGDISAAPFLAGVEAFACPTVFYAIDTHIHSWYPRYAQAFDLCCVAMRDHLPAFLDHRLAPEQVCWLPLFSRDDDGPVDAPRVFETLFVGKNDPSLTPGRWGMLEELRRRVSLIVLQGAYRELFAQAKVVLNVAEHGDLNFRVFEALGCGACLVTPRIGHGLEELFRDGEHLRLYDPNDVNGLADLINELLVDDAGRVRLAAAGHAAVMAGHREAHRAARLLELAARLDLPGLVRIRLERRRAIHDSLRLLYLHWAESSPALAPIYLQHFIRPDPAG